LPTRFQHLLQQTKSTAGTDYVVQSGDTLSGIVRDHLQAQGISTTNSAIYQGVKTLVRENRIADADRIFPGQRLNLALLDKAISRQVIPAARVGQGPVTESLVHRVQHILHPGQMRCSTPHVHDEKTLWKNTLDGPARLSSAYGLRTDPFTGQPRFHDGIDLAADRGTPIRPFREGTVSFSGRKAGFGNVVIVDHGKGLESVYGHTDRNLVKTGMKVTRNTILGEVGSTGRSTGPHLHFEVRKSGQSVDPLPYLSNQPRRMAWAR
jgi:murein DD-endopeptidase MepM/ murein hydrolase activator NlpD